MTQQEAKECAWRAWLACAKFNRASVFNRASTFNLASTGAEVSEDAEHHHFSRWWRASKHTLPGFRRVSGG